MLIKKIPDTSGLVTSTVLNAKFSQVENKIPNNSKYIATQEYDKLTAENFIARLTILACFIEFSTKIHWNIRFGASGGFIHLHNQLSPFNSIIVQMSEKRDLSNRQ